MTPFLHAAQPRWLAAALLAAALSAHSPAIQAQSLQISTATDLRAKPALNAPSRGTLPVGTPAEQLDTKSGWVRIKAGTREGWVRRTHVRPAATAKSAPATPPVAASALNPITGVAGIFSSSSNRPTATTGTRGLTQEQLAHAKPAPAQVQQLDNYAATPAQAQQFARSGRLQAQSIAAYKEGE